MFLKGKDLKSCEKALNSSYLTDEEKLELLRIMTKRGIAQEDDGTVNFVQENQGEKESDFVSSEEDETPVSTPSRAEKISAAKAQKERYSKSSKNAKKKAKSSSGTQIVSTSTPENKHRRRTS